MMYGSGCCAGSSSDRRRARASARIEERPTSKNGKPAVASDDLLLEEPGGESSLSARPNAHSLQQLVDPLVVEMHTVGPPIIVAL